MKASEQFELLSGALLVIGFIVAGLGITTVSWIELYLLAILTTLWGLGEELRELNE